MSASEHFRKWMVRRRKELGITQEALAAQMTNAGVKMYGPTMARIEKGHRGIDLDEAELIAEILGHTVYIAEINESTGQALGAYQRKEEALDLLKSLTELLR